MYDFAKHGRNITNDDIANKIADDIKAICCNDELIELDFKDVDLITTTCIKNIFAPIVSKYGKDDFLKNIAFINTNKNMQIIISHGLQNLLDS